MARFLGAMFVTLLFTVPALAGTREMIAALGAGDIDAMRAELEAGADPNGGPWVPDMATGLPVYLAAKAGRADMLALLVEHGADIDRRDRNRERPLDGAARRGELEIVRLLVGAGATPDPREDDADARVPLVEAAKGRHVEVVHFLLDHGADPDRASKYDGTALHQAAKLRDTALAARLIAMGAAVAPRERLGRETPLHHAFTPDMVRLLIAAGAPVDARDWDGETPLFQAAQIGQHELVAALIEAGAGVDIPDENGRSPLVALLTNRPGPDWRDALDDPFVSTRALILAQPHRRPDLDVDATARLLAGLTQDLDTALAEAVWGGWEEAARILVSRGALGQARTLDGRAALAGAFHYPGLAMFELLVEANTNLSVHGSETIVAAAAAGRRRATAVREPFRMRRAASATPGMLFIQPCFGFQSERFMRLHGPSRSGRGRKDGDTLILQTHMDHVADRDVRERRARKARDGAVAVRPRAAQMKVDMAALIDDGGHFRGHGVHLGRAQDLDAFGAHENLDRVTRGEAFRLEACLEAVSAREAEVGAWAFLGSSDALDAAHRVDREGAKEPLAGIPFGAKDIIDVHGWPTEFGSPIYAGYVSPRDAACIALLKEAGAICLGKTVSTELGHVFPGRTRNPFDPSRTPGGSSSGSGAAVGAGMVPFALGTQTSGSVLRPAAFCGVVGYKPTYGAIVNSGVFPNAPSFDTVGVMCREVEDLPLLFAAITRSPLGAVRPLPSEPRIGLVHSPDWEKAEPSTIDLLQDAAVRLGRSGFAVADSIMPESFARLGFLHRMISGFEFSRGIAWEKNNRRDDLSTKLLQGRLQDGLDVTLEEYYAYLDELDELRRSYNALFAEFDAMIYPVAPGEPPVGLDSTGSAVFNIPWSALQLPAITLPVFTGPNGKPVGLQLIGRLRDDATLFVLAEKVGAALA